jgi:Flp pilus assembly CpaF family ATPase
VKHSELRARIRSEVAADLAETTTSGMTVADRREMARRFAVARLRAEADRAVSSGHAPLGPLEEQSVAQEVIDALFGLGRLQHLIEDSSIENIDVNGCDRVWVTYEDGRKERLPRVADHDDELIEILRSAAARLGLSERRFDTSHPELDLRLPDGSRLSALMSVTARPVVSIRRHRLVDVSLRDLVQMGSMSEDVASFLAAAVRARKNIVVGGAMNAGKTTLVRAMAAEIPLRERVVTIEQSLELGLDGLPKRFPDVVALEAREANAEGEGAFSMARLVRRAVRMNADRVIVGEVLGDEVLPMLNAMGQGRSGSLCTIHADSSMGVFRRLATYAVQATERLPIEASYLLIAGAVHFVVYVDVEEEPPPSSRGAEERSHFFAARRRRFVSSIREVVDAEGLQIVSNEVFRPGPDRRAVTGAPLRTATVGELTANGYELPLPAGESLAAFAGTPEP